MVLSLVYCPLAVSIFPTTTLPQCVPMIVPLLHVHSLTGTRAHRYCVLLEQQLWRLYRRGSSSYTPLLVSLPACKEASKSAVEEALRDCGLSSLEDALEGGSRRWLIILDGFDEVQGNTNFIIGNKLNRLRGVKVT